MQDWQPTATISTLRDRAQFLRDIREFFHQRQVMEVETPTLSRGTITDLHLDPFVTPFEFDQSGEIQSLYLQTSPEFAMKRLLVAGSGPIYQIGKAFRNEAAGRHHNPEFTMLEWYRPGFDDHKLMSEIDELVQTLLATQPALKFSYQQVFLDYLKFDPLEIELHALRQKVAEYSKDEWLQSESKDTILQWLFCTEIEPQLGKVGEDIVPCFVYDFPAEQASLAKLNRKDTRVAHRFELYFNGIELANGFYELDDAKEQLIRFEKDNEQRLEANKPQRPIDKRFIEALEHGLPDCSGVALGIDRLFMLKQQLSSIEQAISFPIDRA